MASNGSKHVINIKTSIYRLKLFMVIRTGQIRMNVTGQSMRFQIPHLLPMDQPEALIAEINSFAATVN